MNITAIKPQVDTANIPIEQLSGNTQISKQDKVAELSRRFEAVMLRQMLSESQKTVFKSKFSDDSVASSIYKDMNITQMAESISKSDTFGLSKSLKQQLIHQVAPETKDQTNSISGVTNGQHAILTQSREK